MLTELYKSGSHQCFGFYLDIRHGINANQFLIVDDGHAALLDPGGDLVYSQIHEHLKAQPSVDTLDFVIASHQDPDIVSSIGRWATVSDCTILVPGVWERFIPHFCRPTKISDLESRLVGIPDQGAVIRLGNAELLALPAHFLHSEGNIQIYDGEAKILFSGDLGGSVSEGHPDGLPVDDFQAIAPALERFNRRLMGSNRVCRWWATMVRELDVEWIVPQHGPSFRGKRMVEQFIDWVEQLDCGIDLMSQTNYQVPRSWSGVPLIQKP